jgi:mRNA-degrading endonuclease RelE of RelBE toxin-antitoxin system
LAAERARELIQKLGKENIAFMKNKDRLTKNGELRIDNCRKYDLGSGYRLICVEQDEDLIVTYVGTHDDCDRWIENNRRFEAESGEVTGAFDSPDENKRADPETPEPDEQMDYDEILMQKIDDPMLRKIFWGLCDKST